MSFPPHGGPRGPPPMGFGFRGPPPGGPPPRGMMPMNGPPPRMMNLGMRPMGPRPNLPPTQQKSKLVPQEIEDGEVTERPPVTTVFVGSISDRAPDLMVRTLLQRCGTVVSWKRVQGADGKLQGFGFCEFEQPEATLRSIRLLHEWQIGEKKLVVKVDEKTRRMLDDYEKAHRQNEDDKQREDRLAQAALEAVMKEFANDLRRMAPTPSGQRNQDFRPPIAIGPKADEGLDDMPVDEDAKQLINREINRFREAYKDDEVMTELRRDKPGDDKDADKQGSKEEGKGEEKREREDRRRDRSRSRERRDDRRDDRRERDRDRERRSDKPSERKERDRPDRGERSERGGDRDRAERDRSERTERDRSERDRSERDRSERDRSERDRSERDRSERDRKQDRSERKSRERTPRASSRREPEEDPEERYERLRLERQLRDKEQAYQERLKNWEVRERKKIREYERERTRSEERKQEEKKEARRLREFLEDYDDDKDDSKYYKGGNFTRRLKEREKEAEADIRDRQKEKEEIEVLRQKLIDEGHPDPEAEISRQSSGPVRRILTKEPSPDTPSGLPPPRLSSSRHQAQDNGYQNDSHASYQSDSGRYNSAPLDDNDSRNASYSGEAHERTEDEPASKKKKLTVNDVFNNEEEDADSQRKQLLMSIDEDTKKSAAEQKRLAIKRLIDRIPTDKHQLFAWTIDWSMLDQTLLKTRIKPWVNKKITDYIGEEEPTLTEFICQKVMSRSQAQSILTDVAMVLDDEAEVFVVKMWRLIVYETEAKKAGLVK